LAIAVDNLADAESLTAIDKEEEVSYWINVSVYRINYVNNFFNLLHLATGNQTKISK
jgi:hypothetical protein